MPVISASLFARFASRQQESPTMQAVAALRGQFGGHEVMSVAEGEKLRAARPPRHDKAVRRTKAAAQGDAHQERRRRRPAKGRKAAKAGPSSGTGATLADAGAASQPLDPTERAA